MSSDRYIYYKGDEEFTVKAFSKYADQKQEMDKFLETLISPLIADTSRNILDAGCGVGHLNALLSSISPESTFLGIDQTGFLIEEAKKRYHDRAKLSFAIDDVENLPIQYTKAFDISISRAVISWIPYYEEFMKALLAVTKDHIFVSSLFYEGDIDFITQVREFKKEAGKEHFSEYRNVYSLPHFKNFLLGLGVKDVVVYDFEIGIDIPKGPIDILGTYTEKLENGKRLQISGAVLMNWKWIRIDV